MAKSAKKYQMDYLALRGFQLEREWSTKMLFMSEDNSVEIYYWKSREEWTLIVNGIQIFTGVDYKGLKQHIKNNFVK